MLHVTCDLCGKELRPGEDHRYVVKLEVFAAPDPAEKVARSRTLFELWRAGAIEIGDTPSPPRPSRPSRPSLLPARMMPRRRSFGALAGRIALLHALAHIELNAIDLAWDIVARFSSEGLPLRFFDDWVGVAAEEAEHFALLDARLLAEFPPVPIAVSRCDAVMNFDCASRLGKIATPTLVFCAEDDFLTPSYFSRQLAQLIPGAELRTIKRGGHACSQTVPKEFNEAVLPFLLSRRHEGSLDRKLGSHVA